MSTLASPKIQYLPSGGVISTSMVFSTKDYQNSANATYLHVSTFNSVNTVPYTFKTDRERMLYKVGQLATVPGATGY
uniref:Uncharacterized protein n=1 Tax=viral metagenome TaxID=1070528 RepID=A0A6C0L6J7_9ZZZZ